MHCTNQAHLGLAALDPELRSVVEEDSVLDTRLDGGRDREGRSVWDAALDSELIGLEEVGGKVEAADDPPGLALPPPPPYHPLSLLELRHESGLCRAARLDVVGLESQGVIYLLLFILHHTSLAKMHKSCLNNRMSLSLFSCPPP